MASTLAPLPPDKSLHERHLIHDESRSDDEYSIEYYYDYEIVDETTVNNDVDGQPKEDLHNKSMSSVSVETVEDDDDDDEYIYEEEILEVIVESNEENESTSAPPPLPKPQAKIPDSIPSPILPKESTPKPPPTKVLSPPVATKSSPTAPRYGLKDAPVLMTPSKKRAQAANSAGLSELSKQLRILQAKNESQNVDINRLERQLRILADLQGISVGDLRKALEDACASEAFGELQNRVSKLKYELEAATLAKQKELRQDAAAPYIANLELRVGELEEVEEKQMKEIRDLYDGLRQEKARSTRFESENEKLKGAVQDMIQRVKSETARGADVEKHYKKQIQEMREHQSKIMYEEAGRSRGGSSSGAGSKKTQPGAKNRFGMVSPEMATDYERMVQLLQKKDEELQKVQAKLHANEIRQAEKLKDAEERWRQTEMDMKVEADKLALTVKELEDADGQNGLRLAQFKARFTVQDERIVDMGQQLDSLYTAFNLLNEEIDSENDKRVAMLSNLQDADAEIARQTKMKEDEQKVKQRGNRGHSFSPSPVAKTSGTTITSGSAHGSNRAGVPYSGKALAVVEARRSPIASVAPVAPATPVNDRRFHDTNLNSNDIIDRSYGDYFETPGTPHSAASFSTLTNDRTYGHHNEIPTAYATAPMAHATAFHPAPERTPSTWELLREQDKQNRPGMRGGSDHQLEGELIRGPLIVESNSMIRKWKTKPARIFLRNEGYQWEIGDKRSFPLQFGVSKVEFNPNYPLSFAVALDPSSSHVPTIRAAAVNEYDYHRWMAALFKATTGEEYEGGLDVPQQTPAQWYHPNPPPPPPSNSSGGGSDSKNYPSSNGRFSHLLSSPKSNRKQPPASRKASPASNRSIQSAHITEESQVDELKRVLELSKYDT